MVTGLSYRNVSKCKSMIMIIIRQGMSLFLLSNITSEVLRNSSQIVQSEALMEHL